MLIVSLLPTTASELLLAINWAIYLKYLIYLPTNTYAYVLII